MRAPARRLLPGVATASAAAAGAILGGAVLALTTAAVLRYVFGTSTAWLEDVLRWSMAWMTFLGAAALGLRNDHIAMDAVSRALPRRMRRWLDVLAAVLSIMCAGMLGWIGWSAVQTSMMFGQRSSSGAFPSWWGQAAVPVGCLLMAATLTFHVWRRWRGDPDAGDVGAGPVTGHRDEAQP